MVNLKKKELTLQDVFKTFLENSILTDCIYDSINCLIQKGYRIINNTGFSWCFTPKGYYRYKLKKGLKDGLIGHRYICKNTDIEVLKGEQSYKIEIDVPEKEIYLIF